MSRRIDKPWGYTNLNADPIKIVEVSTPHLGDVVRLEDDYKR